LQRFWLLRLLARCRNLCYSLMLHSCWSCINCINLCLVLAIGIGAITVAFCWRTVSANSLPSLSVWQQFPLAERGREVSSSTFVGLDHAVSSRQDGSCFWLQLW
jgi:hypothetical protein